MARSNSLSAAFVRNVGAPGVYADGNGLTLRVDGSGKRWVQRVTINGKRRNMGLGGYPPVSLGRARELAVSNAQAIREGRDPIEEKRRALEDARRPDKPTFTEAAESVIDLRRPTWRNAKHAAQWSSTLATYANPIIGRKPVDEVTTADVLAVLAPIWTSKTETASRVRQRMETVFDWAVAQGWRRDNPSGRSIIRALPRASRLKAHHAALPYADVPAALVRVRESTADAVTRLCFEFVVLTAVRSGEARLARWDEVDWESCTWTIPAGRMKASREHRVPLSGRAVEVLKDAKAASDDSELIFPASRAGKPLSDMTLLRLLKRLEIPCVVHGFRSSFRDWVIERTAVPWAVGEAALAHRLGDSTETAYARTDLFERRRELMQDWANYVAG